MIFLQIMKRMLSIVDILDRYGSMKNAVLNISAISFV